MHDRRDARRVGKGRGWAAALAGLVALAIVAGVSAPGRPLESRPLAHAQGVPGVVRYVVVTERSEARYRVREQLAGLSFPNDAVGATSAVEGGIALDAQGRVLAAESRFAVDVRGLRSDEPRRDNYIRRNTLESERFPSVVLVPVEIRGVPVPLPTGGRVPLELVGDLTVRDVTRRLTWEAVATFDGPSVAVQARTAFRFGEFGLRIPRVAVVLSVEDRIQLETDFVLRRSP